MKLPLSNIAGNGFKGEIDVSITGDNPKKMPFSKVKMDVQFFGPQDEAVGATKWGQGSVAGQNSFVTGATMAHERYAPD
jgi:hypothetical protein